MSIQKFVGCHFFNSWSDNFHALRKNFLKRDFPDKAVQAHAAVCFRITISRQRMVGSGSIIPCTFRRQ